MAFPPLNRVTQVSLQWQKDRPVDIILNLKERTRVPPFRGDKTEISPRNTIPPTSTAKLAPHDQSETGFAARMPSHGERALSAEARLCGMSTEQSAGARYIRCVTEL